MFTQNCKGSQYKQTHINTHQVKMKLQRYSPKRQIHHAYFVYVVCCFISSVRSCRHVRMAIYTYHNFHFAALTLVFKDYKVSIIRTTIDNCPDKISGKERMQNDGLVTISLKRWLSRLETKETNRKRLGFTHCLLRFNTRQTTCPLFLL